MFSDVGGVRDEGEAGGGGAENKRGFFTETQGIHFGFVRGKWSLFNLLINIIFRIRWGNGLEG